MDLDKNVKPKTVVMYKWGIKSDIDYTIMNIEMKTDN